MAIITRTTHAGTTPLRLTVGVTQGSMTLTFSAGELTTTGDRGVPSRTFSKAAPDSVVLVAHATQNKDYLGTLCQAPGNVLAVVVRSRLHRSDDFPALPAGHVALLGGTPFFQTVVPAGAVTLGDVHVFQVHPGFPGPGVEGFNVWLF